MELKIEKTADGIVLNVKGRLDSYWSSHFASELDRIIREGCNSVTLDFSEVEFLSSAGIGVIMRYYNAMSGMRGTLCIVKPQKLVRSVLEMTGLDKYLIDEASADDASPVPEDTRELEQVVLQGTQYKALCLDPECGMQLRTFGDPSVLFSTNGNDDETIRIEYPEHSVGIGIGAFGESRVQCRDRFGEYLAIGGCTSYMPSDDTNTPDYLIQEGDYIPSVVALYGLRCEGKYSHFLRFEPKPNGNPYPLSHLLDASFELTGASSVVMALIAESAGLVGTTLIRSPELQRPPRGIFAFPDIRHWISYTAEPAYAHTMAVVVGIATTRTDTQFSSFLRPVARDDGTRYAHFHAIPCNVQPIGNGVIHLRETVSDIIRHSPPLDVVHLINDTRQVVGSGESEFLRGACWIAPIQGVSS